MYGVHKVKLYILDAAQSANSMSDCSFSSWYCLASSKLKQCNLNLFELLFLRNSLSFK